MRLRDHGSVLALEAGRHQRAGCDQGHAAGQAQAERRPADDRSLYQGVPGADRVHDPGAHSVARRTVGKVKLVTYESKEPSAFAEMLGGLIDANVQASPSKQKDFDTLTARVGIWVTDIDEGVTLVFESGRLTVYNGLEPRRTITIRAEAETVMSLSNLKIGVFGLPVYYDGVGRGVALKLLRRKLQIDGLVPNIATLNRVTRIFSVQ